MQEALSHVVFGAVPFPTRDAPNRISTPRGRFVRPDAGPYHRARLPRRPTTDRLDVSGPQRPRAWVAVWVVLVCVQAAVGEKPYRADVAGLQPDTQLTVNPNTLTGENLGGLRLPVALSPIEPGREASFSARRVWAWSESGAVLPDGRTAPPVRRLLLEGDARVDLGTNSFTASRALVWMQSLPPGDPDFGPNVRQIFVFFDRVSTPTAAAGLAVSADRLSVQGVFEVNGGTVVKADVFERQRPAGPFVSEGERELVAHLTALATPGAPVVASLPPSGLSRQPDLSQPGLSRPALPGIGVGEQLTLDDVDATLPEGSVQDPIFAAGGVFGISPGEQITIVEADEEQPDSNVIMISGGVVVQYWHPTKRQTLQGSAERAVIFTDPGPLQDALRLDGEAVQGIYLEGDVMITDGDYTLRSPKAYYDVRANRALILDAVLWTWDEARSMPLYVRAQVIRQESAGQFSATRAKMTNTAFFKPHISLGASRLTLTRRERENRRDKWIADVRNMTLNVGPVPFFYWPIFYGDPRDIPIRDLRFENSSVSGGVIRSAWDVFGLLGLDRPDNVSGRFLFDGYFDRGLGLGFEFSWETENGLGEAFVYGLPNDTGTDQLASGATRERTGEFRGIATAEHREALDDRWTLSLEGAYVSDENFVDAFLDPLSSDSRELVNSVHLRYLAEQSGLTAEVRGSFNDFVPNDYLLQSTGFNTERLPEATYFRAGDDLLPEAAPGLLGYYSETRAGLIRANFVEPTADELGFDTGRRAREALGLSPNQSPADELRAAGFPDSEVARFDTRHEVEAHLRTGRVNVTPFVVGRFTAYDRTFEDFSPDADDRSRAWGSAGIRAATTIQRVHNAIESALLDLHRIRHIIEPSVTVWAAGANLDEGDLPEFDADVEGIAEGTSARLALDQTWQTQRGGPGRWRSVDVFKLNAELVGHSGDANDTAIPKFFNYRPEFSNQGDFFGLSGSWQVSEALGITGGTIFDIDRGRQARTSIGAVITQGDLFAAFADLNYIDAFDTTFLGLGARYALSDKYDFSGTVVFDQDASEFQTLSAIFTRDFPNIVLGFGVTFNNITNETSFVFSFQPQGLEVGGFQAQGVGASNARQQRSSFGG